MSYKFYTGIGSRQTPPDVLARMTQIATWLEEEGYILRSGGAEGADSAFEYGVHNAANKRIFLPWKDFNNNNSTLYLDNIPSAVYNEAVMLARQFHPTYDTLKQGAQKLMIRNSLQIVGNCDPDSLTKFVICWTPKGKDDGGTGQAIRLAQSRLVPIINLNHFADDAFDTKEKLMEFVNGRSLADIRGFSGRYAFLSNMQFVETPIEYDGKMFHFVETAFQYAKHKYLSSDVKLGTLGRTVEEYKDKILECDSNNDPYAAKRAAQDINPCLFEDWFTDAVSIMQELCAKKFSDYNMRLLLLSTGSTPLVESNVWKDTYWGVYKGHGKNHLGAILMAVRAFLKAHPPDRYASAIQWIDEEQKGE